MILDSRIPARPSGVLFDHGTGKAIRFAIKFDTDSGYYESFAVAPDGESKLCTEDNKPIVIKGKAVGKLELLPLKDAHLLGIKKSGMKHSTIEPMPAEQKRAGLEEYKKVYTEVWRWRGEAKKCVADRWDEFLSTNSFLDAFILKRRIG